MNNIRLVLVIALWLLAISFAFVSCNSSVDKKHNEEKAIKEENLDAKSLLQGIWVDELTDDVVFKISGDTIIYPDKTSLPVYFCIIGDSLVVGNSSTSFRSEGAKECRSEDDSLSANNSSTRQLVNSSTENNSSTRQLVNSSTANNSSTRQLVNSSTENNLSTANKYFVKKISANSFCFVSQDGDLMRLVKSTREADSLEFTTKPIQPIIKGELVKGDTIVYYNNVRYRVYTTINPSKYKVYKNTINEDGLMVQNVYYDNIIHIAIFEGRNRLYSCDFNKNMFSRSIPEAVLKQCVFGNMTFAGVNEKGFKLSAIIGLPEEAGTYIVDTLVYKP